MRTTFDRTDLDLEIAREEIRAAMEMMPKESATILGRLVTAHVVLCRLIDQRQKKKLELPLALKLYRRIVLALTKN